MMTLIFDPTQVTKLLLRGTDFFSNSTKFLQFQVDIQKSRHSQITDIDLQCLGYGHFNKQKTLQNFCIYLRGILTAIKQIKTMKLTLAGFELGENKILQKISNDIIKNTKESIKLLWFHTSNMSGCTIDDFQSILRLIYQLSHINFEDISLQFSNWRFLSTQPNIIDIQQIFKQLIQNASFSKINNQRFRLQMSSWYYQQPMAKQFLKFKVGREQVLEMFQLNEKELQGMMDNDKEFRMRVEEFYKGEYTEQALFPIKVDQFHKKMQSMIKSLLSLMDHLKQFEIDFRNWHSILKMKTLKKRLDNVIKKDTYEKSIVSKRIGLEDNQGETELKMIFVM